MSCPSRVRIVEVGPRDGLQNESLTVPAEVKVALIEALADAGLTSIEAGSFVSPKWVPQMADTAEVLAKLTPRPDVSYPVLVPNLQGLDWALACGVREIAVFGAASESFSRRNINCSIAESLDRFAPVAEKALAAGLEVRGYVSCVLGCPYEGEIAPDAVARVAASLLAMGCYEISLGDTIGTGTPLKARQLIERVASHLTFHWSGSRCISTTPMARRWRISSLVSNSACRSSTARWRVSAAALTRRAPPETSPRKMSFTC